MKRKLGNITDIQFGLYAKSEVRGDIKYLLGKHFDEMGKPTDFDGSYVPPDEKVEKFLLQPDDIILAGKGFRNFAWVYNPQIGPAVASSLFFVIKPNPKVVLSKYLALFLNTEKTQHQFNLLGAGATIPSIPKKELQQIMIPLPPLPVQEEIINMANLLDLDISLNHQIIEKKKAIFQSIFTQLITNQIGKHGK